jgi:thiol-disulfide isomerase/thioredoxin
MRFSLPTAYVTPVLCFMDKPLLQRRQLFYLGLGIAGASAAAIALPRLKTASTATPSAPSAVAIPDSPTSADADETAIAQSATALPEFRGISAWLNSDPLTIAGLKGSVVLVQFWTFSCINCQRTLPYVTQWHRDYAAQGLTVIGVHTPEFAFERDVDNITEALQKHQITYPVPVDNAFETWRAYQNRYWPHLYLADRQGVLRYDHIGEGAYRETEQMIQRLLAAA